jgi:hypothetical protein
MTLLILVLLQVKHFLVDWILQTDSQIKHKGQYLHPVGIYHSLQHAAFTAVIAWVVNPSLALTLGIVDGLLHYHIDWAKQNLSSHHGLSTNNKGFWMLMGLDQLLHQFTYILLVFILID